MKYLNILLSVTLLLVAAKATTLACPAEKRTMTIRLADGTSVRAVLHGDEHASWFTTADGGTVINGPSGLVRTTPGASAIIASAYNHSNISLRGTATRAIPRTLGTCRYPVVLVNFPDKENLDKDAVITMVTARRESQRTLLDLHGLTAGSATDYFTDQSDGAFNPVFDFYGPYTAKQPSTVYGFDNGTTHDRYVLSLYEEMLSEHLLRDARFTGNADRLEYGKTGNGKGCETVIIVYAGAGQSSTGNPSDIWPMVTSSVTDGRTVMFAPSSTTAGRPALGAFVHEFGHVLGLPDLYDTDQEMNGLAENTPGDFSPMDNGCHAMEGLVPTNLTCAEKELLGWAAPDALTTYSTMTLRTSSGGSVYRGHRCDHPGEDTYIEYRHNSGWDAGLPVPSVIAIQTDRRTDACATGDGITNDRRWETHNGVNAHAAMPLFRVTAVYRPTTTTWSRNLQSGLHFLPVDKTPDGATVTTIGDPGQNPGGTVFLYVHDNQKHPVTNARASIPGCVPDTEHNLPEGYYQMDITEKGINPTTLTVASNGYKEKTISDTDGLRNTLVTVRLTKGTEPEKPGKRPGVTITPAKDEGYYIITATEGHQVDWLVVNSTVVDSDSPVRLTEGSNRITARLKDGTTVTTVVEL